MAVGDDDEEIVPGTEGQGTEGQDPAGGNDEAEIPAEHPDPEADDGESEVVDTGSRGSRAETRIQRLANEAKEAREEAAAARRDAEDARRQAWQRSQAVSEEERQARRQLMTPEERVSDDMAAMRREFASQRQQDHLNTATLLDKTAYDAKATINPVYQKYKDEVEAKFADQVRQGKPVEREILLKLILGERALAGASTGGASRRQARSRVESQRVAPANGRGDTATTRNKAGDTAESRLKDTYI